MDIDLFDYHLPREMIAQSKSLPRDSSRLFYIDARQDEPYHEHLVFNNIIGKLEKGDILVLNRSRVIPARVPVQKLTGGKAEVLLLECSQGDSWEALVGGKNIEEGSLLETRDESMKISVDDRLKEGKCRVSFIRDETTVGHNGVLEWLRKWGLMPTPPYIRRMLEDPEEYQTVYGDIEGSVAAPTAGLHFTEDLLNKIEQKGVKVLYVILHVGMGTFAPVKVDDIYDHDMEVEKFFIPDDVKEELVSAVNDFLKTGRRRIWAVGTTVMRTLESAFDEDANFIRSSGGTGLYITPGHRFHLPYKGFITNFHLPRSTPLILVSAFHDREKVLSAYEEAKEQGYRFYSLGDSMMIRRA